MELFRRFFRSQDDFSFEHPDVLVLSCPRSGTHLLQSFLSSHPSVHRRGEIYLRYQRKQLGGKWNQNEPGKCNVAILMYRDIPIFESLGGDFQRIKVFHLIRNAEDVARSQLQLIHNRKIFGKDFPAHVKRYEDIPAGSPLKVDEVFFQSEIQRIQKAQRKYRSTLQGMNIFEISYEELGQGKDVETLEPELSRRILSFLGLAQTLPLRTHLRRNSS